MRIPSVLLSIWTLSVCVCACDDDAVSANEGLSEPLQVSSAQFISGALPGLPPPDSGIVVDGGVAPAVLDVSVADTVIQQGQEGLVFTGHASPDAQTVAVRFADLGSGYWVLPVGAADPSDDDFLSWQLSADFARDLPPGEHQLVFASIDANGNSGTQSELLACLDTPVPDNLNICVPTRTPPAVVVSLHWDAPVDLDLSVQDPNGVTIGGKSSGAGASSSSANEGALDRDSNRDCAIDGIDREDIVWQGKPTSGTYQVWVDLFGACGQPAATFTVSLWLAEPQADGTQRLIEQTEPIANGELVAEQANGGQSKGLFVGQFAIQ